MFVIKKKSAQKSLAEYARLRNSFLCLAGYFVAVRALYLVVNRNR